MIERLCLQVRTPILDGGKVVWVWKTIAAAKDENELSCMIPKDRESDCRIVISGSKLDEYKTYRDKKKRNYKKKKLQFSKRLSDVMRKKFVTRSDITRMCGVSRGSMEAYINGKSIPNEENLQKLCRVLEVTRAELLGDE